MQNALARFTESLQKKFASHVTGEPEDQLRAPFELLLAEAGQVGGIEVVAIGETLLGEGGGRPDYGVSAGRLLCGYVELKAPGKGADTSTYTGHDRRQWERFRKLPNILYSDGREFALYRSGELQKIVRLEGDPRRAGVSATSSDNARQLTLLLSDFLQWEPIVPGSSKQLAEYLAPLCRMLRDDVLDALRNKAAGVEAAASDWRRYLFPGAENEQFADAYAQTVTFALLLARSNGSDTLFLDRAIASLTHANSLLSRALQVLTDPLVKEHLSTSLGLIQRVINKVPTGTMSGGRRDPWLHFYEDFLAEYDPALRKDAGAYYTPVEVVQAQVRIVDDLLRRKLGKIHGFATGGVNVLDPAVGTGTYLLGIAEHALETVLQEEGPGAVAARADVLGSSLYGFEVMVGPYAVASLRLTRMLQQYGGHVPGDGVQIMLNNTLESPYEQIPELPLLYRPIGLEHKRAKRVKETVPILVCIGNPPYDRHAAVTADNKAMAGGWVRWGDDGKAMHAILDDFIAPVKAAGKGGDLKNLYNLYVYFWRWALWKTFEHDLALGPGVASYISASSFLDGDAFLGMRRHMRKVCDEIWVIDLGGEGRGTRKDDNVFAIQTPVAIAVAVRYSGPKPGEPAKVHYARVEGTRAEKLGSLEVLTSLDGLAFVACDDGWDAPFKPAGQGDYFSWPQLKDLMPWQVSGAQLKRTWPIGPIREVVETRWNALLRSNNRSQAFKESRDRTINKVVISLFEDYTQPPICDLLPGEPSAPIVPYGYRTLDVQYVIADNRLGDYLRPTLWRAHSDRQVYFSSLLTKPLGSGPAVTISAAIPDMDYFSGRGAKDILPLYRDAAATQPNLHPQLLSMLGKDLGAQPAAEDLAAYFCAVLAHPAFTVRFHDELATRELRVPLTTDAELFHQAVALGRELLFLQSYGERFVQGQQRPQSRVKNLKAVARTPLPEKFAYDEALQLLRVGDGEFGPVSKAVYDYEVSGLKVVQSWLGYRMRNRKGKKSSPLDDIGPVEWSSELTSGLLQLLNVLTCTLEVHVRQAELLEKVLVGPLLSGDALNDVSPQWRDAPKNSGSGELSLE